MELDLYQYRENLSYEKEHELSKEFLIIDVMVIKKTKGVVIEKDIGRIFRDHNLVEFKSEKDSFSVRDYNKVLGYAQLYSSFEDVPLSDISVTISLTMYSQALEGYLKNEMNQEIRSMGDGIYYIQGEKFPVQILESKKLSKANLFLRNLRSNLTVDDAAETAKAYAGLKDVEPKNAYLEGLLNANPIVFREVRLVNEEAKEIIMKAAEETGWLEQYRVRISRETARENSREIAKGFKADNIPLQVIVKNTGLSLQEVGAL